MGIFYFSIFLGVGAGLLQIAGYIFYAKKIKLGRIKPNAASWSIWTFGSILESVSYVAVTGDWVKNLLPITCVLSAIILFFYCLYNGNFGKILNFEWILLAMDFFAIFLWWLFQSAIYANFFLVLTAIISFIPIMRHVWNNPMVEDAIPWYLWTAAYCILAVVIIFRWEKWEDLVYPITFAILHIIIAILALDNRIPKTLKFNRVLSKMH